MGLNVWFNLRNFRVVSCCTKIVCGIGDGGCERLLDKTLFENEDVDLFQNVVHPKVLWAVSCCKKNRLWRPWWSKVENDLFVLGVIGVASCFAFAKQL